MDPVDLPADVQEGSGLQGQHPRELVHRLQDRAGQRGSGQRRLRTLRRSRDQKGKEPVDAGHHQIRPAAAGRSGRSGLHRPGEGPAAQLDRPLHRRGGQLRHHRGRRAHGVHHPLRYALRRHLHGHVPRARVREEVGGQAGEPGRGGRLCPQGRRQVRL